MFLLNTTFIINTTEYEWWQEWMKSVYITQIAQTCKKDGVCATHKLFKIDKMSDGSEEVTLSSQWLCENITSLSIVEQLNRKLTSELVALKDERCLAFTTLMKEIEL